MAGRSGQQVAKIVSRGPEPVRPIAFNAKDRAACMANRVVGKDGSLLDAEVDLPMRSTGMQWGVGFLLCCGSINTIPPTVKGCHSGSTSGGSAGERGRCLQSHKRRSEVLPRESEVLETVNNKNRISTLTATVMNYASERTNYAKTMR